MTKEMRKKREENCSPSAKAYRRTLLFEQQNDERRVRDALDDDEVREALKLMHERNERARKKQDENGSKTAKINRGGASYRTGGRAPISGCREKR
ncbi:flagellar motility protein MotE (MotC chaperone) [Bradyrhizobium sp. USDA 4011]